MVKETADIDWDDQDAKYLPFLIEFATKIIRKKITTDNNYTAYLSDDVEFQMAVVAYTAYLYETKALSTILFGKDEAPPAFPLGVRSIIQSLRHEINTNRRLAGEEVEVDG